MIKINKITFLFVIIEKILIPNIQYIRPPGSIIYDWGGRYAIE
jgi:hypothetical protein